MNCRLVRGRHAVPIGGVALGVVLAGCGSGHKTATNGTRAVRAKATPVKAVPSPKGAVAPSTLGLAGLTKLVGVQRGAAPPIQGLDKLPITQAISTLSRDLNQFWSQEFARSGVRWPTVQEVLVKSAPVLTGCKTTIDPTDSMFLCFGSSVYTFYWTVPWIQQHIDTGSGRVNLALGMASLYSDAPLALFGYYQRHDSGAESTSEWYEQKFCLAGVYASSLNNRKLVEQSDMQTIENFLNASSGGSGSGASARQQLQGAFAAGFNSGSPATCGRP